MKLDLLDKLDKVDAPPFLLTRIEQRILEQQKQNVPKLLVYVLSALGALVITFNILTVSQLNNSGNDASGIFENMDIKTSNQLYK